MKTTEQRKNDFITRAKRVHDGENLDYSKVIYVNNRTPVTIIDPIYGEYRQTPSNHLKGHGHPSRRSEKISVSKRMSADDFIRKAKEVHKGEKLDYSKVKYTNMHTKVCIISHDIRPDGTEYGEFWQEPSAHLKGSSHPDIAHERRSESQRYTTESFIEQARHCHPDDDYDYSLVEYVNSREKIKIICNKTNSDGKSHGLFLATPDNFLQGKGCPKCGNSISMGEDFIYHLIEDDLGTGEVVRRTRSIVEGAELDIYIPSRRLAFEFNGLLWHCERFKEDRRYHLNKTEKCAENGIVLIHIFEDEYLSKRDILVSKIKRILKTDKNITRVNARDCKISELSTDEAVSFYEKNHIQGYVRSTMHYGLKLHDNIVSAMSFTKRFDEWELTRFASDITMNVRGAASKLFSHFVTDNKPNYIKSFLDRRWAMTDRKNVYDYLGFKLDGILQPDYRYTDGHGKRIHKFLFRKQRLSRKHGFPETMTEHEMANKLGFYRIYDCGLFRYVWKNKHNEKI